MKRQDYISWDELFMGIAKLASKRSKDPRTQNGVCIINNKNRMVSIGYNGLTEGMSDDDFSWDRTEKHDYVIHAEVNAILNATVDLEGCILYLYSERCYYPCCECAKQISQAGINEVVLNCVTDDPDVKDKYKGNATKRIFDAASVKIRILNE